MSTSESSSSPDVVVVDLKNPVFAVILAWAVPGLGHLYQGRTAKGWLFMSCILGVFFTGVCLGSNAEVGPARVVYWSRNPTRLAYACQVATGVVALPALAQYHWAGQGKTEENSPLGRLMWPVDAHPHRDMDDVDVIQNSLGRNFELGTLYTMIAGLLNIFVMFDAFSGPAPLYDDRSDPNSHAKTPPKPKPKPSS